MVQQDAKEDTAARAAGPEIRVEGVGLTYPGRAGAVRALQDVNLAVEAGRFACLVGPSGCGKSTLLDIVGGLARAHEGRVSIGPGREGEPRVAIVFQRPALFPWKTVLGNIAFGCEAYGMRRAEAAERARAMLETVGLQGFGHAYPHELSGGMASRVGIARALALRPDVLLMDEPFAAVDAHTRVLLQEELRRIVADASITVLFVTHDVAEAVYLGDVVFVMGARPGRIIHSARPGAAAHDRGSAEFAGLTADILHRLAPAAPATTNGPHA
jgi:NitT/TauT family transport system ATP-binding protein